jgi:hypothetical protein
MKSNNQKLKNARRNHETWKRNYQINKKKNQSSENKPVTMMEFIRYFRLFRWAMLILLLILLGIISFLPLPWETRMIVSSLIIIVFLLGDIANKLKKSR